MSVVITDDLIRAVSRQAELRTLFGAADEYKNGRDKRRFACLIGTDGCELLDLEHVNPDAVGQDFANASVITWRSGLTSPTPHVMRSGYTYEGNAYPHLKTQVTPAVA